MLGEVLFENLEYGAYLLDTEGESYNENAKYSLAEFNKLHVRRVRLPDGRSNVIYLFSDTFENDLKMTQSKNFIVPPSYRKLYYPWISFGQFMGRRYRMNLVRERKTRVELIRGLTKLIPYPTKFLIKGKENIFFSVSDLVENLGSITDRFPIKKVYTQFWGELDILLKKLTPEIDDTKKDPNWNNRIMIIDSDKFKFKTGAKISENRRNPLFLLYLAFLRTRNLSSLGVNQDMLICSRNMFLKFNPAQLTPDRWSKFRIALFKVMNANIDDYMDQLTDEELEEVIPTSADHITQNIVDNTIKPFTRHVSPSTRGVLANAIDNKIKEEVLVKDAIANIVKQDVAAVSKNISPNKTSQKKPTSMVQSLVKDTKSIRNTNPYDPLTKKKENLFNAIIKDYKPLSMTTGQYVPDELDEDDKESILDYEEEIKDDVNDILTNDKDVAEEVLDEIQDKVAPMRNLKTSPVNSARDKKLREAQKKVVVKNSSIEDILGKESTHVPIESSNKSTVLKTSNQNVHNITFANFDKTYIKTLYDKDILACFDMLKDKESPFYITGIDIKDTSTTMDLKDTWSVHLVDENGKRHTIKIDIPKFYQDRFMLIGGNKYIILKQNFYNPLVKDTPNVVILTTNYNKVTITRKSTKSLAVIEKIFSLIRLIHKKGDNDIFISGDCTSVNKAYISTIEYDEIGRRLFKFSSNNCEIYFSRKHIKENLQESIPKNIKGDEFFIGVEGGIPILINEDTGLDRKGRTIADIIEQNLSDEYRALYSTIKAPKQSMFVEGTLANQDIPIVVVLMMWIGLTETLNRIGINWRFRTDLKRIPKENTGMSYIRFSDGFLEYERQTFAELILNGLTKIGPENKTFESMDAEEGYINYIYSLWGSYKGDTQLKNFYQFLVDPITKQVCQDLLLPDTPDGLLIHAVKMLCDNKHQSKAYDLSYRVRSVEMIPAILYSHIAAQYMTYVRSGRKQPMTLKQNAIIQSLQALKTVDEYSTLNPAIEVAKVHTISSKGYKGSNSDHSYDEAKRSYDPSAIGKLAISTSPDANVGVNKELVVEPTLTNVRGYRDPVEDPETLRDVNIFSPVELLTPGTARNDDGIRTAIANKQSQHLVPVEDASPALISNGFDEALQFHLSNDFVINAEEDGKVVEINEETGFMVVQYKSGTTQAIYTKPEVVKNSGGGFYLSNQLKPTLTKVGQTFKKDEALAYHDKYFRHSKLNGLRYAIGPLAKVAFMSTYNTYEDAGICTSQLADKMKTNIVYLEIGKFKKNSNILYMVKIGDKVGIGDTLIKHEAGVDDNEIAKYLTKLSEENRTVLEEETKTDFKTNHAGTIVDIKVYTLHDPSNLSPSLGKIVKEYFNQGKMKKEFLEKYDQSPGIIKAGYMLRDDTEPIVSRYNSIKKHKGVDVLIEIFIEHSDVMGVGDKVALYGPNKQIISEVIPDGYEPYSEFRPDEEISVLTSPGTIARRMTPSVLHISAAMKIMLELKRRIKKEIKYS